MEEMMMSINSEWLALILNGKKTIEFRKKVPKNYVGWCYLYCTKAKPNLYIPYLADDYLQPYIAEEPTLDIDTLANGKVVARFWYDSNAEIDMNSEFAFDKFDDILKQGRITRNGLEKYGLGSKTLFAIPIEKLTIFGDIDCLSLSDFGLKQAPQSWCYLKEECEHD